MDLDRHRLFYIQVTPLQEVRVQLEMMRMMIFWMKTVRKVVCKMGGVGGGDCQGPGQGQDLGLGPRLGIGVVVLMIRMNMLMWTMMMMKTGWMIGRKMEE